MKYIFIPKKKLSVYCYSIISILLLSAITFILLDYSYLLAYQFMPKTDVITEETQKRFQNLYQNTEKIAYLTFDDGPSKVVTPKILDILDKEEIQASFFVIGKNVEQFPDIIKRQYESGNFIANHTYSHQNEKLYSSKKNFLDEILKTDAAISKAIGVADYRCHIFRFPNGSMARAYHSQKQKCMEYLKEIDYTYLDWNVLNNDSMQKYSPTMLLNNLKHSAKNKGTMVVLMHDTGDVNKTYDVLEDSIHYLKEQGYSFRTLSDLIK